MGRLRPPRAFNLAKIKRNSVSNERAELYLFQKKTEAGELYLLLIVSLM